MTFQYTHAHTHAELMRAAEAQEPLIGVLFDWVYDKPGYIDIPGAAGALRPRVVRLVKAWGVNTAKRDGRLVYDEAPFGEPRQCETRARPLHLFLEVSQQTARTLYGLSRRNPEAFMGLCAVTLTEAGFARSMRSRAAEPVQTLVPAKPVKPTKEVKAPKAVKAVKPVKVPSAHLYALEAVVDDPTLQALTQFNKMLTRVLSSCKPRA